MLIIKTRGRDRFFRASDSAINLYLRHCFVVVAIVVVVLVVIGLFDCFLFV